MADVLTDGREWPRISVVTPSLNQGKYIEKTIRSVLLQNYPNLEYIIMDGGSTDQTLQIIKKYERFIDFWVSEKDRGQSDALNRAFQRATGQLFAWLNADDHYMPGALQYVADCLPNQDGIGALVGACNYVSPSGEFICRRPANALTYEQMIDWEKNHFMQPSCFFTRRAWEECGPLDEQLHYVMDFDLWMKIEAKFQLVGTERLLSQAVIHPDAKTWAGLENNLKELTILLLNKYQEYELVADYIERFVSLVQNQKRELARLRNRLVIRFLRRIKNGFRYFHDLGTRVLNSSR